MYGAGKKGTFHPLIDVLSFGYSLSSQHHEEPETMEGHFFNKIPFPQKKRLSKYRTDQEYLNEWKVVFNLSDVQSIVKCVESNPVCSDTAAFLVVFYAFVLLYERRGYTLANMKCVVRGLNLITTKDLSFARGYVFVELTNVILTSVHADDELLALVMAHFLANNCLSKDVYPLMIRVFSNAFTLSSDQSTEIVFYCIDKLIQENMPVIDYDDIQSLVILLQPAVIKLHRVCLHIVGALSTKVEDSSIRDIAAQIPSSLARMISNETSVITLPIDDDNNRCDFRKGNGDMAFIDTDFPGEFSRFPWEEIRNCPKVKSFLTRKEKMYIRIVKSFLKVASVHAKEIFDEATRRVLEAVKSKSIFAQVLLSFLCLFQSVLRDHLITILLPCLLRSELFTESIHIFSSDSFDVVCNAMRHAVFAMIRDLAPDFGVTTLDKMRDKPFLCVEFLCWIFAHIDKFDVQSLFRERTLKAIFEAGRRLQQLPHTDAVIKCRSSFFVVLNTLATDYHYFSCELFTERYLWFMFERPLTDTMIITYRNCLAAAQNNDEIVFPAVFIDRVLRVCILAQGEYVKLAEQLSTAIVEGLSINMKWMKHYRTFIDLFLSFVRLTKSRLLLINALELLLISAMSDIDFHLSIAKGMEIVACVELVYGLEPPKDVKHLLYALLAKSRSFQNRFIIQVPMAILVLLGAFGRSKDINQVLDFLGALVSYSHYNKIMAHNGLLDLILIKYITSDTKVIELDGHRMHLTADIGKCERIIQDIAMIKSNSYVLRRVIEAVDSNDKAEKLLTLLTRAVPYGSVPQLVIGSVPTQFMAEGLFSSSLNNGFCVSFQMMTDQDAWPSAHIEAVILSICDKADRSLKITVSGDELAATVIADGFKTSVVVCRGIPSCQLLDVRLGFQIMEHCCIKITTVIDNRRVNDSDLCAFQFQDGPLRIESGGTCKSWCKRDMLIAGVFSSLVLYSGYFDLHELANHRNKILFTTECIETVRRQEATGISIFTYEAVIPQANILHVALTTDIVNRILQKYEIPGMLSCVQLLLSFSEIPQRYLDVEALLHSLLLRETLGWFDYNQLHHILSVMTFEPLIDTWLKSILINLWIWRKAGPFALKLIMRKWLDLFDSNTKLVTGKEVFSHLLRHFRIFFTSEFATFSGTDCFDQRFSPSDVIMCREIFLVLMRKSAVSLSSSDINRFVPYVSSLESKELLLALLSVLCDIACFVPIDAEFRQLYQLLGRDLDVDIMVIGAIHRLARENVFRCMLDMYPILNNIDVLDRILDSFTELPNTFPLICLLSLKFNRLDIWDTFADKCSIARTAISGNYGWFMFPLIVLVNATTPGLLSSICRLIRSIMNGSELQDIIVFLNALAFALNKETSALIFMLLKELGQGSQKEVLADVCFNCSFFHFEHKRHQNMLLLAMMKDGIHVEVAKDHGSAIDQVRDLEQIKNFIAFFNETNTRMWVEVRLDAQNHWKDRGIAQMGLDLSRELHSDNMTISILRYFLEKETMNSMTRRDVETNMCDEIPRRLEKYGSDSQLRLFELLARLSIYLDSYVHSKVPSPQYLSEFNKETKHELVKLRTSPKLTQLDFRTDETFCVLYTPMKMKRITKRKPRSTSICQNPLYQVKCSRIKKTSIKKGLLFTLADQYFILDGKVYRLPECNVFHRKRDGNETALEFYMLSGKAILVDFAPVTSSKVAKNLQKLPCLKGKVHDPSSLALACYTNQWTQRQITNFEYLMIMNIISGRSFNDLKLSPIMPNVLQQILSSDGESVSAREPFCVPSLFKTAFESLYANRVSLESEETTERIPSFIDRHFGYAMTKELPHYKLFTKPHPPRLPVIEAMTEAVESQILDSGFIQFCSVLEQTPDQLKFLLFTSDSETREIVIRLPSSVKLSERVITKGLPPSAMISGFKKYAIVYECDSMEVTVLKSGRYFSTRYFYSEVPIALCCSRDRILFCRDQTTIVLKSECGYTVLCQTEAPVRRLAVSPEFKMFAIATRDGNVSLYSLNKGALVNRMKVPGKVKVLVITTLLGFVVVFTKDHVFTFTVDGERVCDGVECPGVTQAYPFVGPNGVDFVAFETESHKVSCFDVFHPERCHVICEALISSVSVQFVAPLKAFVVLLRNGSLRVIPCNIA